MRYTDCLPVRSLPRMSVSTLFHGLGTSQTRSYPLGRYEWIGLCSQRRSRRHLSFSRLLSNVCVTPMPPWILHHPWEGSAYLPGQTGVNVFVFPLQWGSVKLYWSVLGHFRPCCLFCSEHRKATDSTSAELASGFSRLFLLQGVLGIPWGKHFISMKWMSSSGELFYGFFLYHRMVRSCRQGARP